MKRGIALVLSLLCLACSGPEHDWSPEEIGNAEFFFAALHADLRASEIENLGEPGFDDDQEEAVSLEFREKALQNARNVRNEVLDKAHPELRRHFRGEFERSQQLFLEARRDGNTRLESEAIALRNTFGDWWLRYRAQVVVPSL
jgi:hypothetical protein